jgi:hypothetical protein
MSAHFHLLHLLLFECLDDDDDDQLLIWFATFIVHAEKMSVSQPRWGEHAKKLVSSSSISLITQSQFTFCFSTTDLHSVHEGK